MSIVREVLGKKRKSDLKSYNDKRKRDKPQVASDWKLKAIAKHQKNVFLRYSSSGTNPDQVQIESACVTCMSNPVNKQEYHIQCLSIVGSWLKGKW